MRGFLGVGFRFGTKAGNSGAKRQRAGMNPTPFEMALTNSTMLSGRKCPMRPRFHPGNLVRRDEFQTILGCGEFSPALHRLLWELPERHAGVEPISHARSRRTVQVAQHDHRLARFRTHAKNRVHSRSAAAVAVGPRLVRPVRSHCNHLNHAENCEVARIAGHKAIDSGCVQDGGKVSV